MEYETYEYYVAKINKLELQNELIKFKLWLENADNEDAKAMFQKVIIKVEELTIIEKEEQAIRRTERLERERKAAEALLQQRKDRLITRITNSGIKYDDWIEWANSLYCITSEFKVISYAAKWKEEKSWSCDSEIGCLERIEILIGYKIADRKRGIGNTDNDLNNLDALDDNK
jgi:hypothetical protein